MLLNKQVGMSYNDDGTYDGQPFIDGALFQEELLWLDTLGKKRIQVWINSPGGSIMHGMNIFNAILKSNTPVDTYNVGVAASIAGAVFMAGRKRYMCDYAQFMMHPVGGVDDAKSMDAFKESCVNMLSAKAGLESTTISYMMDVTTWLGASDCLTHGIATDIEVTKESNKKYMPSEAKAMLAYSNNIINTQINKMEKITNKLNLVSGANEEAILAAINKLEQANNDATAAIAEAQARVESLESELATAKAALEEANAATEAAEEAQAETEATNLISTFTAQIGNNPETLVKWTNLAKADFAGTKLLLESLPINKVAPTPQNINTTGTPKYTVASVMAEIQNRNK
jgi:ATP-dependent Clp protease, protease subunit